MVVVALAFLAAAAAPDPATQPVPVNRQPTAKPADQIQNKPIVVEGKKRDEDRIQCISEAPTGSLMPQRTCHTVAEWAELRERELLSVKKWREKIDAEAYARQKARMTGH